MKRTIIVPVFLVVVSFLLYREIRPEDQMPEQNAVEAGSPDRVESGESVLVLDQSPFAQRFGDEQLSVEEELELIQLAYRDYLSYVKKGYRRPIGDNRDFVDVMTGKNRHGIAPIPPGHSRINHRRELVDRSGIPYAIHLLSQDTIEVRAAGNDGVLWTDDDPVSLTVSGARIKEELNAR